MSLARSCRRPAPAAQAPPRNKQKTLENTREKDETIVAADDEEVKADEAMDEFASYFSGEKVPKVLITTSIHPTKVRRCAKGRRVRGRLEEIWRQQHAGARTGGNGFAALTCNACARQIMYDFVKDILHVFPGSVYYARKNYEVRRRCDARAVRRGVVPMPRGRAVRSARSPSTRQNVTSPT